MKTIPPEWEEWRASRAGNDYQGVVIDTKTGRSVAVAYDRRDTQLIAAAPAMLEALALYLHDCEDEGLDYNEGTYRRALSAVNNLEREEQE